MELAASLVQKQERYVQYCEDLEHYVPYCEDLERYVQYRQDLEQDINRKYLPWRLELIVTDCDCCWRRFEARVENGGLTIKG